MGYNAFVVASHLVMMIVLVAVIVRVLTLVGLTRESQGWVFPMPIALLCVAMIVERGFYVAARFLVSAGINLWEAHPAPGILAALVALAGFWFMPAYFKARGMDAIQVRKRCAAELGGLAIIWISIAGVLY